MGAVDLLCRPSATRLTCLKGARGGRARLTQVNARFVGSRTIGTTCREKVAMFGPNIVNDELQALKVDLSRLLADQAESIVDQSKSQAEALADQIKAALNELGEVLSDEEAQLTKLVSERPVTALTSAFALGMIVGLMMRRH
jgi:ElaB/YqjD/DUF883 family membrane-anchored ribosome-binding protein